MRIFVSGFQVLRRLRCQIVFSLVPVFLNAQTTQGIISGQVHDSLTDQPLNGALISCTNQDSGLETTVSTDASGAYSFPLLSPGQYGLKVLLAGYQPQELYELNLAVGGRLAVRFRLRPLYDVWESRQYQAVVYPESNHVITFFGPDVDHNRFASFRANHGENSNLDTSVSDVIDYRLIRDLPLLGRDIYSLLVVLPGVTADTASGRGINVSVAGQRASASNFLLDGVESNNYLITGPLAALSPEAIQEYRISTNNYSAEYGRTGSFIANAITRPGTGSWHGGAWVFLKNQKLNANGFQENRLGIPRPPFHEMDPGFSLGGPIVKDRLFTAGTFEHIRFRSRTDPQDFFLPTRAFASSLSDSSAAGRLLKPFASLLPSDGSASLASVTVAPPTALNQTSFVDRTDIVLNGGKQRVTLRGALFDFSEPGLLYNPYPGFSSSLYQKTSSFAIGWTASLSASITNEVRAGRNGQRFTFDRPHPEVPVLQSSDFARLPGSQAFDGFRNRDQTWELVDNVSFARANHFYRLGAGWLGRKIRSALAANLQGSYTFDNLKDFAGGIPSSFTLAYQRFSTDPSVVPDVNREYAYRQAYLFAQDSYQLSRRLTLNYGFRYEFFGAPANTGQAKDSLIQLGSGDTLVQRLSTAYFAQPGSGRQQIYSAIEGNWAGRFAFAFDPQGTGTSVIRGSYGLFYDRPFDNYWQTVPTNSLLNGYSTSITRPLYMQPVNFLLPARQIAVAYPPDLPLPGPIDSVLFQPRLRAASVQSAFLTLENRLSSAISFQLLGIGTFGRRLVTTDLINRNYSILPDYVNDNPNGNFNAQLQTVSYRGNQGKSDYLGGAAILRFRSRSAEGQISYTLSHAIDNQSDPLAGTFRNYNFGSILTSEGSPVIAAFTKQFDSQADRGNADFDQRHNLVLYSVLESPTFSHPVLRRLLRDWHIGTIAAFRSGFPYSVRAPDGVPYQPVYINNRTDLITSPSAAFTDIAIPGGKQLLNSAAFQSPAPGTIGNIGRNAFRGPGLFNIDFSVAREFRFSRLGEAGRLVMRADLFNALNHANLNNPSAAYGCSCGFGNAYYGRAETNSGFPLLSPLTETARQIQLVLRVNF